MGWSNPLPYSFIRNIQLLSEDQWRILSRLRLKRLDYQLDHYKSIDFSLLKNHATLEKLDLMYAGKLSQKQWEDIANLKVELTLLFNDGAKIPIEYINLLQATEKLNLESGNLTKSEIEQLQYIHLPNLKELTLRLNGLKGLRVDFLAPHLVHLDLFSTDITGSTVNHLKEMDALEELFLGATDITAGAVRNLSKIVTLKKIDLSGNNLNGADFSALKNLPHLEYLDLRETNISRNDLQTLKALTQLQKLDLSKLNSATVRPQDIDELIAVLPNCEVIR